MSPLQSRDYLFIVQIITMFGPVIPQLVGGSLALATWARSWLRHWITVTAIHAVVNHFKSTETQEF